MMAANCCRPAMELAPSIPQVFRFGQFEADAARNTLKRKGVSVKIQDQPFRVLVLLLERAGEIVTREELRQKLWPEGIYVDFEGSLNVILKKLRLALDDDSDNPRFIETVPRRGYRFIAPVSVTPGDQAARPFMAMAGVPANGKSLAAGEELASESGRAGAAPSAIPPSSRVGTRRLLIFAGLAIVLILAGIAYQMRPHPSATSGAQKRVMLAVLPFQNLSNDPEQEYFSDGLTEETITDLGQLSPEHLGVIARTSAMVYKHTNKTISQIGGELGVDYVLEGSVRREGGKVRISAQLIRVKDQTHLWAQNYDRELQDFLGVQNDLGEMISRQVDLHLTPEEQGELETARKVDPEAYELYLKGLYYWNTLTATGLRQAISYFEQATKKDPNYALAYAGLVDCYAMLPMIGDAPPRESFPAAQAAAARALELNDALAQAHDSDARIKLFYEWDWPECEKQCLRAIALNRNLAGAHVRYAHLLSNVGRHREALSEAERARELDPLSLITNALQGMFLLQARQDDAALQQLQKTVEINPHFWVAHFQLGKVYEDKGMYPEAIAEFITARDLSEGNSETVASLGHAYAGSGQQDAARDVLAALQRRSQQNYVPPFNLALVYAGLGEKDRALESLEKGYEARDVHMIFLKVDSRWDAFRADPRFVGLMRRMRLGRE